MRKKLGKREREAGKRLRRARVCSLSAGADAAPLKLGRAHSSRYFRKFLCVADRRNDLSKGAEESGT